MIFQDLNELYDRLRSQPEYGVAPLGRSLQKITFKVVLRPDGSLVSIEDVRDHTGRSPRPLQVEVLGGAKPSGSGINPCLLWDNSQYMLGVKAEDSNPDRTEKTFAGFVERHRSVESEIDDPGFRAVCRFLESWDPAAHRDDAVLLDAGLTGYGLFQLAGETGWVHESPAVQAWWDDQPLDADPVEEQCLVTGELRPIARTHRKIKGVVGGQGSGGTIAGFNRSAYESYGRSQSFNAPVGEAVAFRYVTALNALLDGPKKGRHRILLGDMTVAFWTDRPSGVEDFFARFATEGERGMEDLEESQDEAVRERVRAILRSLKRGASDPETLDVDSDATMYHILALSPNAARIAVRFYHRGTVRELVENLASHFHDLFVATPTYGGKGRGEPEFPSFRDLLDQTARERKDIPPILAAPLLKAAITGGPYPPALYTAVLRRVAAERNPRRGRYLRACVIKGFLNRNLDKELPMALDLERTDPAYRLGRLFAALEKTQQDALGRDLNRTIRDTYYGSASATPRSVFPRLLRTYQHHLAKMEGGLRVHRERLVQEIMGPITEFPPHLDLAGQGLFAIGYYHQVDDLYRRKKAASDA